jgi:hypothetical protein
MANADEQYLRDVAAFSADPYQREAIHQQQRGVIEALITERGGSPATLDALGQEISTEWVRFPGKRPIPGAVHRDHKRQGVIQALGGRKGSEAIALLAGRDLWGNGEGKHCYIPRRAVIWLACTMGWRATAASPWVKAERRLRNASQGLLREDWAPANHPSGKLKSIGNMLAEAIYAIDEAEPAFGRKIPTGYPPVDDKAIKALIDWLKNFNPEADPIFPKYFGVEAPGRGLEAEALALRAAIGSCAVIVHEIVGGALSMAKLDQAVASLAYVVTGKPLEQRQVSSWRLTFLEARGFT